MKLLRKIARLLQRKPKFLLKGEHAIKEAFTCGGVTYYCWDDAFNQPYERALKALTFYEEFRMRTTREFLVRHCDSVDAILNNPKKIEVGRLAILNKQLKERLEWIMEPDILYKLASVIFFDKNESPFTYDFKYSARKIEHWKKHTGMNDFFLQMPIVQLIPYLKGSEINFEAYSKLVRDMTQIHLANITGNISAESKKSDSDKS